MFEAVITHNILLILPLLFCSFNFIAPFLTNHDSNIRNFLLISNASASLVSIIILDCFFLTGINLKLNLFSFSKYKIILETEAIGLLFLTMVSILSVIALLYTVKFLEINTKNNSSKFLFFMNCSILSTYIIALSANLFTMFVGYEFLTLFSIPLIIHQNNGDIKDQLSTYVKIISVSAKILFLPAIIFIYSKIGHGNFIKYGFLSIHFSRIESLILLLFFIFGIAKAALYPMHKWLPAAMIASYPVSALLHSVLVVKAGIFCIYKIFLYVFGLNYIRLISGNYNWLILIPIITILYSSIEAIRNEKLKTVLAYSTINQLSISMLGAFLFTSKGMIAAITHMITHAFTKISIFYAAGNIYSIKRFYKIYELNNIHNILPKTSGILLLASLSLVGIPPFAGFISKYMILSAAIVENNILAIMVLFFSTIFSAIYLYKILSSVYKNEIDKIILTNNLNLQSEENLPKLMLFSLKLCCSFVILFFLIYPLIEKFLVRIT